MNKHDAQKLRILIFTQWYTPGYKAGGPIRSIQNFIDLLGDSYEIFVFTGDRDLGDSHPFPDIKVNTWIQMDLKYSILYTDLQHLKTSQFIQSYKTVDPDIIYLNSMFSYHFFLLPLMAARKLGWQNKIILAPRGMLKSTALKFKKLKKKLFIEFLKRSGFLNGIRFQATNKHEADDIRRYLNIGTDRIFILDNAPYPAGDLQPIIKEKGQLDIIFLGRIHPIKGLDFLLKALSHVDSSVNLEIVGSMEDQAYYASCEGIIKTLPPNIKVKFSGNLPFDEARVRLMHNHILALPTHGENFGHAIFESLSAGRPVLISDQTPWRNLEKKGIGWDLRLDHPEAFSRAIQKIASMGQEEYNSMSQKSFEFSKNYIHESNLKEKYLSSFSMQK